MKNPIAVNNNKLKLKENKSLLKTLSYYIEPLVKGEQLQFKDMENEAALPVYTSSKVKFTLEQTMKAQTGSRCIALLFL